MERIYERKRNSGSFLAFVLIIIGILCIMNKSVWEFNPSGMSNDVRCL